MIDISVCSYEELRAMHAAMLKDVVGYSDNGIEDECPWPFHLLVRAMEMVEYEMALISPR
jgi:hypothetical protein